MQLHKQNGQLSDVYLDVMLSELDRINFIVSEFLVLAKPQAQNYQEADVRLILEEIIMLLESQGILSNVEFETRFAPDVPTIVCEVNQLKQVFVNVVKNGMESMPAGGKITINLTHLPAEGSVLVRMCDQGCGIPEQDLPRLGEPFFTSKASGNGLGLMVSQRIIANHKGSMKINSKVGEGTCVDIRLPTAAL